MNFHAKMLGVLAGSPFIILLIHRVLLAFSRRSSLQMTAVTAALLGYIPTALSLWILVFPDLHSTSHRLVSALYCFLTYTSLAYTYFHFFNTSETARRIRILYEIYQSGHLSSEEIIGLYKTEDIISLRIQRLLGMGQLKHEDGFYVMHDSLLYYSARLVSWWRRILGFDRSARS